MNNSLFDLTDYTIKKEKKRNPRQLAIDIIYTDSTAKAKCCMAVQAGLKYGIQSGMKGICRYYDEEWHAITFVDLDFKNYDHSVHLEAIKEHRPKYATVMDIMTKEWCEHLGVQWYPFEQIMDWAEEINEHAENAILIPKYPEVFEKIPEKYLLGVLMGSGYSKTPPLPLELYKGRRVHILGGSWKRQLKKIEECENLGIEVVSLDNNHLSKVGIYGSFSWPDGETGKLREDLGLSNLTNAWHVACVISFGNIAAKINELYPGGQNVESAETRE